MKKREGFKVVIFEPAKSRIERDECPTCSKPKSEWTRRKDWRCCSKKCTDKFNEMYYCLGWRDLRKKAFFRDNFTCVKCGKQAKKKTVKYWTDDKKWVRGLFAGKNKVLKIWTKTEESQTFTLALIFGDTELIGDHIIPIALGGDEWDLDNVQTLCLKCNKIKTKEDMKKIAEKRREEKKNVHG